MSKQRTPPEPFPACYAQVIPGLEAIAGDEIAQTLGGTVKRTGHGVVVFRVENPDRAILRLRTTEDVFLLAWGSDKLSYRAEDLERIQRWTAREADWDRLLQLHHGIRPKPKGKPTYRLVAQMTGEHGYRRVDVQRALARGLAGKLPASWRPVEENAAVEIWVTVHGATAMCGLRLSDRTMRHRAYKVEHLPASLRPTVAAAMVQLAEVEPGMIVLDPMCGAGTILAELADWVRRRGLRVGYFGGDLDRTALRAAESNLRHLSSGTEEEGCLARWDAGRLPLPDQLADRIISNPPFGKQLSGPDRIGPLYAEMIGEYHRVLKPGGRAVLLASEQEVLREAIEPCFWKRLRQVRVRVLGQPAAITLWQKP